MIKGTARILLVAGLSLSFTSSVAMARLMITLGVSVPKHVKASTPIAVSGIVNGEVGAEFLGVFADKRSCARTYATELRRSPGSGAETLAQQDVQGPFNVTVTLGKYGRHAKYVCVYMFHSKNAAGQPTTDRAKSVRV